MSAAGVSDSATIIAIIPKSEASQLRVSLKIYKGRRLFDARVFMRFASPVDAWAPTRDGFALDISKPPQLRDALLDAESKARARKWIREG